ncbi:MAG: hypothetical protein AB1774_01635 [Bacillota bacterium]
MTVLAPCDTNQQQRNHFRDNLTLPVELLEPIPFLLAEPRKPVTPHCRKADSLRSATPSCKGVVCLFTLPPDTFPVGLHEFLVDRLALSFCDLPQALIRAQSPGSV